MENYEVHPEIAAELAKAAAAVPASQQHVIKQAEKQAASEQVEEQETQEMVENQPAQEQVQQEATSENTAVKQSWRALRSEKDRIQRERDEAIRLLQMQQQYQQPQQIQPQPQEEEINLNEDQLVEGKHLKSYHKKLQALQQQIKTQQQQSYTENSKLRLKAKFPDFDSIVNQDTIEMLQVLQPEVAQTLNASSDIYATGVTAYTLIKNLGLKSDQNYQDDIKRIQTNVAKPKPMASINPQQGESALSKANAFANGLTPELKQQLYKEMMDAKKNY